MKQLFVILITLFMGQSIIAQPKGNPIREYNENGYTSDDVNNFALGRTGDPIAAEWRENLLRIVNNNLKSLGTTMTMANISYIINNTKVKMVTLKSFINSRRFGDKMDFYADKNFTGPVAVFEYEGIEMILWKTICMNLLEVPVEIVQTYTPPASPARKPDTTYTTPGGQVINVYVTANGGNATIENSGNSTNTNEVALEGGEQPQSGRIISAPVDPVYEYRHPQRGGFRQREYRQQRSYTRVNFGIRVNVRGNQQQPASNPPPPPPRQVERRSMGGGRGDRSASTNMGPGRG